MWRVDGCWKCQFTNCGRGKDWVSEEMTEINIDIFNVIQLFCDCFFSFYSTFNTLHLLCIFSHSIAPILYSVFISLELIVTSLDDMSDCLVDQSISQLLWHHHKNALGISWWCTKSNPNWIQDKLEQSVSDWRQGSNARVIGQAKQSVFRIVLTFFFAIQRHIWTLQVGLRQKIPNGHVRNVVIWGNNASTIFPDLMHSSIRVVNQWNPAPQVIQNDHWIKNELVMVCLIIFDIIYD